MVLNSDESPVIIENNKDTGVNVQNNSTLQSWFDENKSPASITRISGNYAGNIGEIGIQVKGNSTADLSGCEVTNFNRYGIRVSRNSSLKGKSLKVHDINNCGIRIQESSSAWVSENSDVFNNRKEGIYVREGSTLNLENSRIRDNRRHGMRASMHCYANITNTEISGNHENGLYYSNYSGGGIYNSLVKGNCIAGSDWIAGIYITGSSHAEIGIEKEDENDPDPVAVISGNKANGLSVSDQSRVSFFIEDDGLSAPARISISDNSYHGVKLDYRSSLKAGRSLDISNNLAHGIFLTKQCQLDLGGDYEPENSQKVTISGNGNNGIYAMNRSTVNLSAVTIATNGGDGLALYDDSYTNISKNNESAQAAPEFSGNVKNGISINSSGLHISDAIIRYTEMGIWYCEATTLHIADSVTFPEAGDANNNTVKCGGEIPVL